MSIVFKHQLSCFLLLLWYFGYISSISFSSNNSYVILNINKACLKMICNMIMFGKIHIWSHFQRDQALHHNICGPWHSSKFLPCSFFFFVSVSVLGWFRHFLQISETSARYCYHGVKKRQRDAKGKYKFGPTAFNDIAYEVISWLHIAAWDPSFRQ